MLLRYFITDNTNIGTLVIGEILPETMLLLLGKMISQKYSISNITKILVSEYSFKIEAENLSFRQLNTDPDYAYTYYNLIDEHVADKDGYLYANIEDMQNYFCNTNSITMLKSIDLSDFKKKYFLSH